MKHLLLIRHAKSDWSHPSLPDKDRPLNKRGQRDAPFMALMCRKTCRRPNILVSSPAVRARETALRFAREYEIPERDIFIHPDLYEAAPETILDVIRSLDDSYGSAAIVGHNPGLVNLSRILLPKHIDSFPTCAVLEMKLETGSFSRITPACAKIRSFLYPKQFSRKDRERHAEIE